MNRINQETDNLDLCKFSELNEPDRKYINEQIVHQYRDGLRNKDREFELNRNFTNNAFKRKT